MFSPSDVTILTIDDDESIRKSISYYLEDFGYNMLSTETGNEGLAIFEQKFPTLVLIDLRMPDMDGLEVLKKIRKISPDTPSIIISGEGLLDDVISSIHLGAWDYITKPIEDMSILDHTIKKVLERMFLRRANKGYQIHLEKMVKEKTLEIEKNKEQLKLALKGTDAGLWDWYIQTGEIVFDERWAEIVGYTLNELQPVNIQTCYNLCHPDDLEKCKLLLKKHFEEETDFYECELRIKHKDGHWVWVLDKGKITRRDAKGAPLRITGTRIDITKRKNNSIELEKTKNYIDNIINSMPSAIIGINLEFEVTLWNNKAAKIIDVETKYALGKKIYDLVPRLGNEIVNIQKAIQEKRVIKKLNVINRNQVNEAYENITVYPLIVTTCDDFQGAVIHIDDVTEQYKMEKRLTQSGKMEALGQLAGGVAHDINNMLGGILGAADILNETVDEKNKIYVNLILRSIEQASKLTSNLLSFSKISQVGANKSTDIHKTIKNTIELLARCIDKKIGLNARYNADMFVVKADNAQLQNLLLNMGINSSQAIDGIGKITYKTKNVEFNEEYCIANNFNIKPGKYIAIYIEDTGCGIPSDNLKKIFEPFFTTKGGENGTGLGLAAAYAIVQKHNGSIEVNSQINVGTTFIIYFPIIESKTTTEKCINNIVISGAGCCVLLVDDEELIRATTEVMLKKLDYKVIQAKNGREAVEIYKEHHENIDIVLLDVLMPEMDGEETFTKLRKINKNAKIIMTSGFPKDKVMNDIDPLCEFLPKPYYQFQLSCLIGKMLSTDS